MIHDTGYPVEMTLVQSISTSRAWCCDWDGVVASIFVNRWTPSQGLSYVYFGG